jgi:hypothetical protein
MAVYKNITGAATTVLITKGGTVSGGIEKILIANVNTSNAVTITVDFYDGTNTFTLIKEVDIPVKSSLVLEDNVRFDSSVYNLRVTTAGTSPNISVIII